MGLFHALFSGHFDRTDLRDKIFDYLRAKKKSQAQLAELCARREEILLLMHEVSLRPSKWLPKYNSLSIAIKQGRENEYLRDIGLKGKVQKETMRRCRMGATQLLLKTDKEIIARCRALIEMDAEDVKSIRAANITEELREELFAFAQTIQTNQGAPLLIQTVRAELSQLDPRMRALSDDEIERLAIYGASEKATRTIIGGLATLSKIIEELVRRQENMIRRELEIITMAETHAHGLLSLPTEEMFELFLRTNVNYENFEEYWAKKFGQRANLAGIKTLAATDPEKAFEEFKDRLVPKKRDNPSFDDFLARVRVLGRIQDELAKNPPDWQEEALFKKVFLSYLAQGAKNVELRIQYVPDYTTDPQKFRQKLNALLHGWRQAMKETQKELDVGVILSFGRQDRRVTQDGELRMIKLAEQQFAAFSERLFPLPIGLLNGAEMIAGDIVIGIDVSTKEEGDPPKKYEEFLKGIKAHNYRHPDRQLYVTFHIGETFEDKTPESAIRWVHEIALMNEAIVQRRMRIGHAIILGVAPNEFVRRKHAKEPREERLDQIAYDLKHAKRLRKAGVSVDEEALRREQSLLMGGGNDIVERQYESKDAEQLRRRQEFVLEELQRMDAVIETNPTSNILINSMVATYERHPIRLFRRKRTRFSINTDDAGIFNTRLVTEYQEIVKSFDLDLKELRRIAETSSSSVFLRTA